MSAGSEFEITTKGCLELQQKRRKVETGENWSAVQFIAAQIRVNKLKDKISKLSILTLNQLDCSKTLLFFN